MGVTGVPNGGYQISNVSVSYGGKTYRVNPVISDTRMQIRLNNPLQPKGDQISIAIHYHFVIPANGSDRMGRVYTSKGVVYTIGQWYPRMCVYDDVEGWNVLPYMGLGEFYCDYGNFDYYITAPAEMIVYGSGDLQNPAQVLTSEEINRLAAAGKSDKTVAIIHADEIGKPAVRPANHGNLTWHFTMKNTRDVAWAASKGLVWDAAKVNLPSGRKASGDVSLSTGIDWRYGLVEGYGVFENTAWRFIQKTFMNIHGTMLSISDPISPVWNIPA